jgi:hypothetical protein
MAPLYKNGLPEIAFALHRRRPTPTVFRSRFCPFSLLLSRLLSVQVSVSLYYCNHNDVCKDLCWVSRARLCPFFPLRVASSRFSIKREGARPLIVTFFVTSC